MDANLNQLLKWAFNSQNQRPFFLDSVANILGYFIHLEVHKISCKMKDDNDIEPIRLYFLNGKGFKILYGISFIAKNPEVAFYNKELALLLIDILNIFLKLIKIEPIDDQAFKENVENIKNCFKLLVDLDFKNDQFLNPTKLKSMIKGGKLNLFKNKSTIRSSNYSETDDSDSILSKNNQELKFKKSLVRSKTLNEPENDLNFDIETRIKEEIKNQIFEATQLAENKEEKFCSNLISSFQTQNRSTVFGNVKSFFDINVDCLKEMQDFLTNVSVTSSFLSYIIMSILKENLLQEQLSLQSQNSLNCISYPYVSFAVIETLSSSLIFFSKENFFKYQSRNVFNELIKLLFRASCSLVQYKEGLIAIENRQTLNKLIITAHLYYEMENLFFTDIVLGIIYLLASAAQSLIWTQEFSIIIFMMSTFFTTKSCQLILNSLHLNLDKNLTKIVSALSLLMSSLQRIKMLFVHHESCTFKKHTRCNLRSFLFHHHNILGQEFSSSKPSCCISFVISIFIDMLPFLKSEAHVFLIMKQFSNTSFCCCFNIHYAFESFLNLAQRFKKLEICVLILSIIENISKNFNSQLNCCKKQFQKNSAISDMSKSVNEFNSNCRIVSIYENLLHSEEPIRNLIAKHLSILIKKEYQPLWDCLSQNITLSIFLSQTSTKETIEICLTLLCQALSNQSVSKMFLASGGLSQLFLFLKDSAVSNLAHQVLELLIESEINTMANQNSSLSPTLDSFLKLLNTSTLSIISEFNKIIISKPDPNLNESFNIYFNQAFLIKKNDEINCDNIISLFYINNLWTIHSRFFRSSSIYLYKIKSSFPELITSSYKIFKSILFALFDQHVLNHILYIPNEKKGFNFIEVVRLLELILPTLICLTPFLIDSNQIVEQDILQLLKEKILQIQTVSSDFKEEFLKILIKMLINSSLRYVQNTKDSINEYSKILFANSTFENCDTSKKLSTSSLNDSNQSDSDKAYEADDENYELYLFNSKPASAFYFKTHIILYSCLCTLAIEILTNLYSENYAQTAIILTFNTLSDYCRESVVNRNIFFQIDFASQILQGFSSILTQDLKNLRPTQIVILDFIFELCSKKMNGKLLKIFLTFFKAKSAPIDLLIQILSSLIKVEYKEYSLKPIYSIEFPAKPKFDTFNKIVSEESSDNSWINVLRSEAISTGASIGWTDAAFALPLHQNKNTCLLNNKKFSLTLWFYVQKPKTFDSFSENQQSKTPNQFQIHIISLVFDTLSLEIWLDIEQQMFHFRSVQISKGTYSLISEILGQCHISFSGHWHHICFNFEEIKKHQLTDAPLIINYIIDGLKEETITINHGCPKSIIRACILVGTVKSLPFKISIQFGNIILFKTRLSLSHCLYLYSLGPDFCDFTLFQIPETQSKLKNPRLFKHSIITKSLLEEYSKLLNSSSFSVLQETIFIVYKPILFHCYLTYSSSPSDSFIIPIATSSRFFTQKFFSSNFSNALQVSHTPIITFSEMKLVCCSNFCQALIEIGGIGVMIFFFAKMIEITSNEEIQAKSLEILLNVCEIHAEIFNTFNYEFNGFSMINLAIQSTNCNVSKKLFKTYLSICVNSLNIKQSVIICSTSFAHLVLAWRAWHKNSDTVFCLYSTIQNLISPENPFREFNLMQMNRSHINDTLLTMLKDTFLQKDEANLLAPLEVIQMIPDIIYTSITTTSYNISLLSDVVDCILLLHQASNTYVSHSRSSFYFLFHSDWQTTCINLTKNKIKESKLNILNTDKWTTISSFEKEKLDPNSHQKEAFNLILAGLIGVVGKVINNASSSNIDKMLGPIVKPEILLVLAHNDNNKVREEVMRCLIFCLKRGRKSECISNFLNKFGLHLFSNQLHQHQTTTVLIELSFTLLWDIECGTAIGWISLNDFGKIEPDQWPYFTILLSLLPGIVYNKSLCHSVLTALQKYFERISNPCSFFKYLFENGFIECLSKILIEWEKFKHDSVSISDGYEIDIIVEDIFKIFHIISRFLFSSNESHFTNIYFQIVELLATFERHSENDAKLWFRESVIVTFEAALEYIESNVANVLKSKENKAKLIQDLTLSTSNIFFTIPESISSFNYNSLQSSAESSYNNELIKESYEHLSSSEINIRFQKFIQRAVDYLTCKENKIFSIEREKFFSRSLLYLMLQVIEINKKSLNRKKKIYWTLLLGSSKEIVKEICSRFILYLLSPIQKYNERLFISSLIMKNVEKIETVFKSDLRFNELIEAFFKDLEFSSEDLETKNSISKFLTLLKCRFNFSRRSHDFYKDVINDWFTEIDCENSQFFSIDEANFTRLNSLFQKVAENAMNITREIVEYQNHERKQYINHLKMSFSERYSIRKAWKNLIEMFTHEKSVWYYPESFSHSWELDPTEGPQRIRRRLRRCNLEISEKFFQSNEKNVKSNELTTNLAYIFQKDIHESDFSALIDRLHTNERILYTTTCVIVAPNCEYSGEILIGDTCIYFVGEQKISVFGSSVFTELWMFNDIKEINKCRYQLQNNAIEMCLINGLSYLISFETKNACEDFLKILLQKSLPNLQEEKSLIAAIQLWREGSMTNFEYLTYLNKISGRSFNDLMQYPVFPFILADYESKQINLKLAQSFRNLSKPVAIQRKDREKYFINQYNYLKDEYERASNQNEVLLPTTGPYHYGSHYSNSGTVLHFLVRLPPFTQMFLNYQDNSFDLPDRTFHSMATSWRLASGDSTTDFKELTPEFFFLPEFLINLEKFNFGKRQNGEVVDNVKLPLWCRNDPRLFILIHRQALESDYVSQTLNKWIDLIFGYKQTGKAAIEAINVFHPATYYGFDASKFEDPLKSKAIQTMIKTFGQMPKQLFTTPHPAILSEKKSDHYKNIACGIDEVIGLKWGNYVGSPSEPTPFVIFRKKNSIQIDSFLSLATNDVFGLEEDTCSLLTYSRQKGGALFNAIFVTSHAIISWNHLDNIIRIKYNKDSPSIPLVSGNFILDKVTRCATIPGRNTLLVGYQSGSIAVYTLSQAIKAKTELKKSKSWFHGHYGPVICLTISKEFNVAVSGGKDGACILWDLNKICYVRTVTQHQEKLISLAISPTLGDIASISESNKISLLRVNTINGFFVGEIKSQETITTLCYSSAPEGISINSIVTGHSNGTIKFWCSWDLSPIRELKDEKFTAPIKCITFTYDNQQLYAASDEGTIIVWGKGNNRKNILIPLF